MSVQLQENQSLLRKIFGVCPCCGELFRLSDLEIHFKQERTPEEYKDWFDKLERLEEQVLGLEERIEMKESMAKDMAREAGRAAAEKALVAAVKKVDYIFSPSKLDLRDSKVMFHPVDFVVFDGMQQHEIKRIVILDRKPQSKVHSDLQKNISAAIKRKAVEWKTIHVTDEGVVSNK